MAVLNIRNLPDEVHARLRVRAAEHGRSMEAEARAILAAACSSDSTEPSPISVEEIQDWVDELYDHDKPEGVVESLIEERREEARREWSS